MDHLKGPPQADVVPHLQHLHPALLVIRDFTDADFASLKAKADKMFSSGASSITGGKKGEKPIRQWEHDGMHVKKMPVDEQGLLRVSVGGGVKYRGESMDYCVYRGSREACLAILEEAVAAMREGGGE